MEELPMHRITATLLSMVAAFALVAGTARAETLSPESVPGATTIDTSKAKEVFDKGGVFVDVRRIGEWDAGRIAGAVHLELEQAFNQESLGKAAGKDKPVVFYCNGAKCPRSAVACEKALGWGYSKVYYFRDGYPAWKTAGNPVE
jgi:rhodanese-related sulfurtransferase